MHEGRRGATPPAMKSVGLLGCLVFVGCAAAAPKPAVLATNSALVPVPAAEPANKVEAPKPVEAAPAPVESDEVLPKIEFTPEGQLRVNTKAKLQAALKAIKNQTSASAVQGILVRSLGKPTWILLPFAVDFRWLANRNDTPWYPTARLFRQPAFGDWGSAIEKMRQALVSL